MYCKDSFTQTTWMNKLKLVLWTNEMCMQSGNVSFRWLESHLWVRSRTFNLTLINSDLNYCRQLWVNVIIGNMMMLPFQFMSHKMYNLDSWDSLYLYQFHGLWNIGVQYHILILAKSIQILTLTPIPLRCFLIMFSHLRLGVPKIFVTC